MNYTPQIQRSHIGLERRILQSPFAFMMPTPKDVELSYNDVEGVLMEQKEKDEEGKGIGQGVYFTKQGQSVEVITLTLHETPAILVSRSS